MSSRALFITAEPPWPLDQGDKLRNYHLLRYLAGGCRVTLATFACPGESTEWQREIGRFCENIHVVPLGRGRMMCSVLRFPHLPVTVAARCSGRMVELLERLTREEKFSLVIACQLKMAGFLRCCRVPWKVLELTDVLSVYRSRMRLVTRGFPQGLFSWFESYRLAYWETRLANEAHLVLLVSEVDAVILRKNVRSRVEVLPNGVDTEYFAVLPDAGEPVILFYGHLRYPPNVDGVVWFCREVLPLVQRAAPEAKVVIAGKEPVPEVVSLAGLPGVTLVGYAPDLRPYLSQASVVVAPLRFGAGIRNKILESLACGRAVVSTSIGCEGLAVLPGVHLEIADEPRDFACKVVKLLHDRERRLLLGRSGRTLVEDLYRWDVVGARLNVLVGNA